MIVPAEYAPGMIDFPALPGMRFDAVAVAAISGCMPTSRRCSRPSATAPSPIPRRGLDQQGFPALHYVAVLPDEAAAAMAAALAETAFQEQCLRPSRQPVAPGSVVSSVGSFERVYIPFGGVPCLDPDPAFPRVGDASSVVCFDRYWQVPGAEAVLGWRVDVATIQVGRTVDIMEIVRTVFGTDVATVDDVEGIMARLAERADRALRAAGER
jgi:hypothetical protein